MSLLNQENIHNITTYDFLPVPPTLIIFYKIWIKIFFVFTSITCSLCLYAQIFHSPKVMGNYTKFMIWNSSQAMITIFAINAAELDSIFPYAVMIITGPIRYLANLGKPVEMALFSAFIINIIAYSYVASVMFLYRYVQLTENWLHKYITQDKYALPCNIISGALGTMIVLVPAIGYFDGSAAIKEVLGDVIKKETDLEDATAIGFLKLPILSICVFIIETLAAMFLGWIYSIKTYRHMQVFKPNLSPSTLRLYKILINSLIFETLSLFLLLIVPLGTTGLMVAFGSRYSSIVLIFTAMSASLFCPVHNLITICFITPYRQAVVEIFRRVFVKLTGSSNQVVNIAQQPIIPVFSTSYVGTNASGQVLT